MIILFADNAQFIEAAGLKDQSVTPNTYINSATVTATLKNKSGVSVPGATNMTGVYVNGSNGTYRFNIDGAAFTAAAVPPGAIYTLVIDAPAIHYHAEPTVVVKVNPGV